MCGVVGFVSNKIEKNKLLKINTFQSHRGPDDSGTFICDDENVHLGMTRLSIIDDVGGKQPMFSEDGNLVIIFNGEIFNASEIRKKLITKGVAFRTSHSDTETILKLYEKIGDKAFAMLNGMFAIAIYDKKKKAIFLARDQIGIKPLYYAFKNGTFCFASEIKPIKEFFPSINFDKQSIYYFFSRQAGCSKNSVYEDIFKLQPGTFLRFDLRKKILTQKIFWVPQIGNFDNKNHFLEEELYNIFKASVKRWCSSDTPIAISLSGGLDSSAILSTMSDIGFKNIKTYSLIYPKNKYLDESANLKQLVNKFETNHKEIIYNDIDIKKELNNMFLALGEPYAGGIPSWFIYKEMSKDVKVCLTGTGGDELFGNYGKSSVYLNNLLGIKRHMGNFWREKSFGNFRSYSGASKYHPNIFNEHIKSNKLFNKEWLCSFEPEITENFLNNNTYRNVGDFITEYDLTTQLPEEFLYVTDRFSMAHSLEVRTPFLDIEFVEKVLSLKNSQRFSVQDPKFLLKKMFKKSLPKEVIEGKKKGFTIDLTKLMKFEIHDELSFLFSRDNLKKSHIFNVNYVNNIFKKFQDGDKNKVDKIWTIYCFLKWLDLNT